MACLRVGCVAINVREIHEISVVAVSIVMPLNGTPLTFPKHAPDVR